MKTSLVLITGLSTSLLLAGSAFAQQSGGFTGQKNTASTPANQTQPGFHGPSQQKVTTVAAAKKLGDDSKVMLQGSIKQHKQGDIYVFEDATGTVDVDIDDDDWNGQSVAPGDKVEIRGEVDKGLRSFEIDVDSIRKL